MELRFPPLSGGVIQGLNDAGIETFEGNYAHFVVRECAQNSLDAAVSLQEPVEMEFALQMIPSGEIPFIKELTQAFKRCGKFWKGDEKASEFFAKAMRLSQSQDIFALRISDFGTTGVPGGDYDMDSPWFGLVRSRGVSIKSDKASAGAFGIGKDAPLAASSFRTALYSSRTVNGDVALQGICRLATHLDSQEKQTQGTGFLGEFAEKASQFLALRKESDIPERFLRKTPGLDIWVLGFQGKLGEWEDGFVAAALENFWPAIQFEKLRMRVGGIQINRQTLPDLMATHFERDQTGKNVYSYFRAVVGEGNKIRRKVLPLAGDCHLHVQMGDHNLPRKICMTRKTGMVIYYFPPRSIRIPFAGLFQCEDQNGNQLLKGLEPPQHHKWDESRAKTPQQKEVLDEIKEWIKSELRTMIPNLDSETINEDSIADLLPDDVPGDVVDNSDTDLGGRPIIPSDVQKFESMQPLVRGPGSGNIGSDAGGRGGGDGDTVNPKKGDGKATGGRINLTGTGGDQKGDAERPSPQIFLRSYPDEGDVGVYNLFLRCSEPYSGAVRIDAVTEDGAPIACPISSASDARGKSVMVEHNQISHVQLDGKSSSEFRIQLQQPLRVALRASAV